MASASPVMIGRRSGRAARAILAIMWFRYSISSVRRLWAMSPRLAMRAAGKLDGPAIIEETQRERLAR